MTVDSMRVVDLLREEGRPFRRDFENLVAEIPSIYANDRLKGNYANLSDSLGSFLCFTILIDNERILAFSGLQKDPFPEGTARALSRTFYTSEIRSPHLRGQTLPGPATKYMLPYQVEAADRHGLTHIFISMQGSLVRRNYLSVVFDLVNRREKTYAGSWTLLDGRYNVCRKLPSGTANPQSGCWQHIAYLDRGARETFPLPKE